MGMGIQGFYNQATQRDFSRDFQMRVMTIGPNVLTEADNVYITTSNLPGYQINNQKVPFMGLDFNLPGSGSFPGSDSWAIKFRCDQQLNIREKLITWQKSIFNAFPDDVDNSTGAYGPKRDESWADLVVFDRDGQTARSIKLIGVYPVKIGDIAYNTTGNGKEVEIDVTLAYQWWRVGNVGGSVVP